MRSIISRSIASSSRSSLTPCRARLISSTALSGRINSYPNLTSKRYASVSVPNHGLDSVPGPAEAVGEPAVDKKKGKIWDNVDEAVKGIKSGDLVLSAGTSDLILRLLIIHFHAVRLYCG